MADLWKILALPVTTPTETLVAGTVDFYEPGTTGESNRKDVYTDSGGTIVAANPYTLGSDATATLYGSGLYHVVIKDVDGNTEYDYDYISPQYEALNFNPETISDLEGVSGYDGAVAHLISRSEIGDNGGGVFYWDSSDLSTEVTADTQQGIYVAPTGDATGASGAWVRFESDIIDPQWFGALGGGATDDAVGLQAAFDLADTLNRNVVINATHYWSGDVTVDGDNITIFNNGKLIVDKYNGQLEINGDNVKLIGGTVTSNIFVTQFTSEVSTGETRFYLDDTSGFIVGDLIRSSYLYPDVTSATITAKTATYIDVDIAPSTSRLTNYLPPGAAGTVFAPAGAYVGHFNAYVPAVQVYGDSCSIENVTFYRTAGQSVRTEDAKGFRLVECIVDESFLDSVAFATSGTGTTTDVEVAGGLFTGPLDIAKQTFVFNGRNSSFLVKDAKIWSTSADSFFYMYTRGNGSKYSFDNCDIKNVKPSYMTAASGYTVSDYGKHPNSLWRSAAEDNNGLTVGDLYINNCKFENVAGSDLINSAITIGVSDYGGFESLIITNSDLDAGVRTEDSTLESSSVIVSNSRFTAGNTSFFNVGSPGVLDISDCIFERIDGQHTTDNANDSAYFGMVIGGDRGSVRNCEFINNVSTPATYVAAPMYINAPNIEILNPTFVGGVPRSGATELLYNIEGAVYKGIDDDTTSYITANHTHRLINIKSINGGRLGGVYYRFDGSGPKFSKRGYWETSVAGYGADWYIPEGSIFTKLSDGSMLQAGSVVYPTTDAASAATDVTLSVDDETGVLAGDYVMVEETDNIVRRYVVDSTAAGSITLTTGLVTGVANGTQMSVFATTTVP